MKLKKTALLCAGLLTVTTAAHAEEDIHNRWYGGIGGGASQLEPDPNNTGFSVDDDSSSGGKIYIGYDATKHLSFEGYYGDLGEAEMAPNGEIEYQVGGISGLYYLFNSLGDEGFKYREGFSIFGKAGIGGLKNESELDFDKLHGAHLMLGAGMEYGWSNGFGLRGELEFFDEDVKFASISLFKRFGGKPAPVEPEPEPEPVVVPAPVPVEPMPAPVVDSDGDGVVDGDDMCPGSKPGVTVDRYGCVFGGVLEGVNFHTASALLTNEAKLILDGAIQELLRYPEVNVEIQAHTDNRGKLSYNQALSDRRASSVYKYLVAGGVEADRLTYNGYGETQPAYRNDTEEGRRQNRRVEFRIIKQ